jgi:hypothetical protein
MCDDNDINDRRADWAQTAVDAFRDQYSGLREPLYEGISDLLCNLMHLSDRHDLDFDDLLRVARDHHEAEIVEDGPRLGTGVKKDWLEAARDYEVYGLKTLPEHGMVPPRSGQNAKEGAG